MITLCYRLKGLFLLWLRDRSYLESYGRVQSKDKKKQTGQREGRTARKQEDSPEIAIEVEIDSSRGGKWREKETEIERKARETVDDRREEREEYGGQQWRTNREEKW